MLSVLPLERRLMFFPSHCKAGMVFAVNPTADKTFQAFKVRSIPLTLDFLPLPIFHYPVPVEQGNRC